MSSNKNMAFPAFDEQGSPGEAMGLTKREYFAAIVLQGLAGRTEERARTEEHRAKDQAEQAVMYADQLIKALSSSDNFHDA